MHPVREYQDKSKLFIRQESLVKWCLLWCDESDPTEAEQEAIRSAAPRGHVDIANLFAIVKSFRPVLLEGMIEALREWGDLEAAQYPLKSWPDGKIIKDLQNLVREVR